MEPKPWCGLIVPLWLSYCLAELEFPLGSIGDHFYHSALLGTLNEIMGTVEVSSLLLAHMFGSDAFTCQLQGQGYSLKGKLGDGWHRSELGD